MNFVSWIKGKFGSKEATLKEYFLEMGIDYYYKKLAIDTCIDLIAKSISRCEVETFEKGKSVRKNNYYLFNVRPNVNQNATSFFHKLVTDLVYNNECLVVMINKQLFIADSYKRKTFALKDNIYTNVVIDGYEVKESILESKVFFFKMRDERIISIIDGMYESLGKLLASSMNYYKRKNNKRVLIKGDFMRAQDTATQEALDEMFESQLKTWFDPDKEGAAFNLQDGYILEDMSDGMNGASGSAGLSRDISALVDDIINYVSMALHVPRGLIKGDVVDVEGQVDSFLMFGVNPIVELIVDELNSVMYSKDEYLQRTYLKIDTSAIKTIDITKLANGLDKLFAVGGLTINEIIMRLGGEPIDEEWANVRYVTKNYERADAVNQGEQSKGGEE